MITFDHPYVLLLIIPVLIAGFVFYRSTRKKFLILSRTLIAVLLVVALANPFSYVEVTRSDQLPDVVLISDTTGSMECFDTTIGSKLFERFSGVFNVRMDSVSGNSTALGEAIIRTANGRNQILLLTDGNSNQGIDLEDALKAANASGTTVSAVVPTLVYSDLSVELTGDKTVIVGNDNVFNITVRQAQPSSRTTYTYRIFVDDNATAVVSGSGNFVNKSSGYLESTVTFTQKFTTVGTHYVTVEITGGSNAIGTNNKFTRSVYVIEKPDIIVVTSENNSSLASIAGNLYNVTAVRDLKEFNNLSSALSKSKVVIMDNVCIKNITDEETSALREFVSDGGGLFVVGGMSSFDRPVSSSYLNSSFEKMLPVLSKPSDWEGDRDVVLVIDISASGENLAADGETQIISSIRKTALNIIDSSYLSDSNVALVVFGKSSERVTDEFHYMNNPVEKAALREAIESLNPSGSTISSDTNLTEGLIKASEITENRIGEPLIVILTDGNIVKGRSSYDSIVDAMKPFADRGSTIMMLNIYSPYSINNDYFRDNTKTPYAQTLTNNYPYGVYMASPRGNPLDPDFESILDDDTKKEENEDKDRTGYTLLTYNSKHFITEDINLTGTKISGFNDVTPKAGSDRLIITDTGSPVLTVWRYGLGRVACLSTDNGRGNGQRWATQLYNSSNAKVISRTINWVMEDPMPQEGVVISCPDTYAGTPVTLTATSYDGTVPVLTLNGKTLDLAMVSKGVYECTITIDEPGRYSVSGYPVVVNYPMEYRDIGQNRDFESLITKYGGTVYPASQISTTSFMDAVSKDMVYKTKILLNYSLFLCLIALVIFLAEIINRRVFEIRKLRRQVAAAEAEEMKKAAESAGYRDDDG
ncbi:VWA domain-containing protein [Methanosarcinaceae archaeon]|nr:VWA domain-containing protein [Methanosarcinaceae archaeon]